MANKVKPVAVEAGELQTIPFTEAQAKRVTELEAAFLAARAELEKFASYLQDEYKPDPSKRWMITGTGFVEQAD